MDYNYPLDTGVNWTCIRHSEDVQNVFLTSYVGSIYVQWPGGKSSTFAVVMKDSQG